MIRTVAAALGVLALTACATPVQQGPLVDIDQAVAAGLTLDPKGGAATQLVTPGSAVQLFEQVCGATWPSYAGIYSAMRNAGVTRLVPDGRVYHPRLNLSVGLQSGESTVCSFVFVTAASPREVEAAIARIAPPIAGTQIVGASIATLYRYDRTGRPIILARPRPWQGGGTLFEMRLGGGL